MHWGNIVFGSAVAIGAAIVVRALSPVDMHVNRRNLQQALRRGGKLADTEKITRFRAKRVQVAATADMNIERVFYRVSATTSSGSTVQTLVQVFYPLAVLFEEREKKRKPGFAQEAEKSPYTLHAGTLQTLYNTEPPDDPLKNEEEEASVSKRRIARLHEELEQLKLLNEFSDLFPALFHFDEKRLITTTEDIGGVRLDYYLVEQSEEMRLEVARQAMRQFATSHQLSQNMQGKMLPGMQYSESALWQFLELGMSMWPKYGVALTEGRMSAMLEALKPVVECLCQGEKGLKMGEATPRNFYFDGAKLRQVDWGRARYDWVSLDLAEFIADPVLDLPLSQEKELHEFYRGQRDLGIDFLQEAAYATIFYRVVLSGYMCQYLSHKKEMTEEQKSEYAGLCWDHEHLLRQWSKLREQVSEWPELRELSQFLNQLSFEVDAL